MCGYRSAAQLRKGHKVRCLPCHAGDKNADHFLVATQDRGLQRSVMRVPGGACVFASVNGVHLETPSAMQQKQVKQVRALLGWVPSSAAWVQGSV